MKALLYSLFLVVILGCFRGNHKGKYDYHDFIVLKIWDKFDVPVKGVTCTVFKDSVEIELNAIFEKRTQFYLLDTDWSAIDSLKFTKRGYTPLVLDTKNSKYFPNQLYLVEEGDDKIFNYWSYLPFKKDSSRIGLISKLRMSSKESQKYEALILQLGLVRDLAYEEKMFQFLKSKSFFQQRGECRIKFYTKASQQAFQATEVAELQTLRASDLIQYAGPVLRFKLLGNICSVKLKPLKTEEFRHWCDNNKTVVVKAFGDDFYLTWPSDIGYGLIDEVNKLWEMGFCETLQANYQVCRPAFD